MKNLKIERKIRIEDILDPWQEKRKQRIAFIMELLESKKEVDEKQFLGSISTEYGIRSRTLEEYLKGLQDYGVIEISDGKIKWTGKRSQAEVQ